MDLTEFVTKALERGDLIGAFSAGVVVLVGLYLRFRPGLEPAPAEQSERSGENARLEQVATRLDAVDQRLGRVESDLEHMPTNKDFHEMEVKFARMSEQIIGIRGTTEGTSRAVGRIEDFMLSMRRDK